MNKAYEEWQLTAELARLELNPAEVEQLAEKAERMRELFLTMSEVEVEHLEPTTHALASGNRVRPDCNEPFDGAHALLDASPESDDKFFLIPNVLQV